MSRTEELEGKLCIMPEGWWEDQFHITGPEPALCRIGKPGVQKRIAGYYMIGYMSQVI